MQSTHTHTFNSSFSGTTRVGRYQKGKTNLDFTEARDSEWQWHRLQVCTSLQTDNHASNPPLSFLRTGCPSCRPTTEGRVCEMVPCPSIRLSAIFAMQHSEMGLLLWARWVRDIIRLLHGWCCSSTGLQHLCTASNAGSTTFSACAGS